MTRLLFTLVALLGTASVSVAQVAQEDTVPPSWQFRAALGTTMALHGMDLATTFYALGRDGTEANPILAPLSDTPAAFGAVKMGIAVGSAYAKVAVYERGHPKIAWAVALGEIALYSWVVHHNQSVIQALP